ncbi:MAG: hypothetical protein ABIH23_29775, partial [bacterium]
EFLERGPQFEERTVPEHVNLVADTTRMHELFSVTGFIRFREGIRRTAAWIMEKMDRCVAS